MVWVLPRPHYRMLHYLYYFPVFFTFVYERYISVVHLWWIFLHENEDTLRPSKDNYDRIKLVGNL